MATRSRYDPYPRPRSNAKGQLNNLGHLELNEVRPFLLGALGVFCEIGAAEEAEHLARSRHYSSSLPPSGGGGDTLFPLNPLGSSQSEFNK